MSGEEKYRWISVQGTATSARWDKSTLKKKLSETTGTQEDNIRKVIYPLPAPDSTDKPNGLIAVEQRTAERIIDKKRKVENKLGLKLKSCLSEPFDEVEVTVGEKQVQILHSDKWASITGSCGLRPKRDGRNYTLQGHYLQIAALRFSLEEELRGLSRYQGSGTRKRKSRGEDDAAAYNTRSGATTPSAVNLTQEAGSGKQSSGKDRSHGSGVTSTSDLPDAEREDEQQSGASHGNAAHNTHVTTVSAGVLHTVLGSNVCGMDDEDVTYPDDSWQKQDKLDFAAEGSETHTGTFNPQDPASRSGSPREQSYRGNTIIQIPISRPTTSGGADASVRKKEEEKKYGDGGNDYDDKEGRRSDSELMNGGIGKPHANGGNKPGSCGKTFDLSQNLKIKVYQRSILEVQVQAIVCSVDAHLSHGSAVAAQLMRQGGSEYSDQVQEAKKGLKRTYLPDYHCVTVLTDRIGQIPFPYVILIYLRDTTRLDVCIRNILEEARKFQITSLGLPLLGTGVGGGSPTNAADDLMRALIKNVGDLGQHLQEIHFVHTDHQTVEAMADALTRIEAATTVTSTTEKKEKSKTCQIL